MMFRGTVHLLGYRLVYHELLIPPGQRAQPGQIAAATSSATTCSISRSRASFTWPAACSTCSASSSRRPIIITCWRRASPTTGGGSTSTGKTSWCGSSSIRSCSGSSDGRSPRRWRSATVTVFLATWLLHAYQSYWLRGSWGFTVPDALFWGILGVLVLVNVQLDARRRPASGRRAAGAGRRDPVDGRIGGRTRREGRGHVHHDRRIVVALVEPQPIGVARPAPPRTLWIMRR